MSLSAEQFARVEKLFFDAQQLTPSDWPKFLDQRCADDETVRAEVRELLNHHRDAQSVWPLHQAIDGHPSQQHLIGKHIGEYRIVELIGEGGMGLVFRAEQEEPVKRTVALKLIRAGMDSADVVSRFESERQALAMMNHPHVARVFDAGTTEDGRHYFVMEYVPGKPVIEYCDEHRLTTAERLDIFLQICDAVHHAHQRGIIHRDLKPSNMLVTNIDGKPVTKVIDFGIAKATANGAGRSLTQRTLLTEVGQLIGTPEYMSPEQAEMGALDIDTRSDIYSAGVVLYEMLCGVAPFDRAQLKQMSFDRVVQMIREVDPPAPSTRLNNLTDETQVPVAKQRQTEPTRLARLLRGELDWITMKALEKDRTRRYTSAAELADDVRRYLDYEPVRAGPPSATYRARKFVRRHRTAVVAATLVLVAILLGAATTAYQARQAFKQKALAEQRFNDVRQLARTMIFDVDDAMEKKGVVKARETLVHSALVYLDRLAADRDVLKDRDFAREIVKGYDRVGRVQYFPTAPSLDNPKAALVSYRKALDLAQLLLERYPNDKELQDDWPYRWMMVADAAQVVEGPGVSREHYLKAADAAQKLVDRDPNNLSAHHAIGLATGRIALTYRDQRNATEAMRWLDRQLAVNSMVAKLQPEDAEAQRSMAAVNSSIGRMLVDLGDPARALEHFRTAREIHVKVSGEMPEQNIHRRSVISSRSYVAQAQSDCLMLDEALTTARKVLEQFESSAAKDRSDSIANQDVAGAHFLIAKILSRMGRTQEALDACNRALDIQRPLADKKNTSLQSRDVLAQMDEFACEMYARLNRPDDALVAANRAQLIVEGSMGFKRQHLGHYPQLADVDHALAVAKLAQGQRDEAHALLATEISMRERLEAANAALPRDRYTMIIALLTLAESQDASEAEAAARKALDRAEKLCTDAPRSERYSTLLARAHLVLAEILAKTGKPDDASKHRDAALALITPITAAHPQFADAQQVATNARAFAAK